jgi:hypothetical protein
LLAYYHQRILEEQRIHEISLGKNQEERERPILML